jgi:hypothetical protein
MMQNIFYGEKCFIPPPKAKSGVYVSRLLKERLI